jgi:hypothetical protein
MGGARLAAVMLQKTGQHSARVPPITETRSDMVVTADPTV